MSEDVGNVINGLIANYAGVSAEALTDPELRLDALNIDSLGVVELLFDIEEKYGVHIDDPLVLRGLTLRDLHALVAELIQRNAATPMPASPDASQANTDASTARAE